MTYEYFCPKCKVEREIVKPASECSLPEFCLICNQSLKRIYSKPQINVPSRGYYNYGIDKYINNKQDLQDAKNKYKDKTGNEMIEIGNEKILPKKQAPYDYAHETAKVKQLLGVE